MDSSCGGIKTIPDRISVYISTIVDSSCAGTKTIPDRISVRISTIVDSSCAVTKAIPDRMSVEISNGDFDAISVTERNCTPKIEWNVTYQIDFLSILSHKMLQIFLKVSPKFF